METLKKKKGTQKWKKKKQMNGGEEGVAFKVTTRVLLFVPYTTEVTYARSRQEQKQIEEKKVKR